MGLHKAVINAIESVTASYRAMEPFDNIPVEDLFGLRKINRANAPPGDFDPDACIVQYLQPVTHRNPDNANAHDSGIGVTTNREFAAKIYGRPGWRMQMYEFLPSCRRARLAAIVTHCMTHPADFGTWIPTAEGVSLDGKGPFGIWTTRFEDTSFNGTSSFCKSANALLEKEYRLIHRSN
jgi:hypothetical protein